MRGPQGPRGPIGPAGATGAAGVAGATGAAGIRGLQGVKGEQGAPGPTGANGLAATISVESSARVPFDDNPYVVNVGTPQAAILRFGIPAGMPGANGEQGPAGKDGKSAYQVAVDNGYIGTEAEWLDSLKGEAGPAGEQGEQGKQGATGPAASIIPFSISKYGVMLGTDEQGEPLMIAFSGFGPTYYTTTYLQEGEWSTGTITVHEGMQYPTSFIMTANGRLRKIHVLFSTNSSAFFVEGSAAHPFVCLAISDSNDLVYRILPETIAYAAPYEGGVNYPQHTTRKGSLTDLDVEIPEGALVAIVAGIKCTGATQEQSTMFSVSGGLYLE